MVSVTGLLSFLFALGSGSQGPGHSSPAATLSLLVTVPGSKLVEAWPEKFDSLTKAEEFARKRGLFVKADKTTVIMVDPEAGDLGRLRKFCDGLDILKRFATGPGLVEMSTLSESEVLGIRELMGHSALLPIYLSLEGRKDFSLRVEPVTGIRFSDGDNSVQDLYCPFEASRPKPVFHQSPTSSERKRAQEILTSRANAGAPSVGLVYLWSGSGTTTKARLDLVRKAHQALIDEEELCRARLDGLWASVVSNLWHGVSSPNRGDSIEKLAPNVQDSIRGIAGNLPGLRGKPLEAFLANGKVTGYRPTFALIFSFTDSAGIRQTSIYAATKP